MNLDQDHDVFAELVSAAATHFAIPEVYVEKDYWITRMLLRLSESEYREQLIFKGGTSLSKAYKLVSRFSEDVDLALCVPGLSSGQAKRYMKDAEATMAADLEYQCNHPRESKGSSFRKTVYRYPRLADGDFGQASEELLLEINAFAVPEPYSQRRVQSIIAEFLQAVDRLDLIAQFGLDAFSLHVLHVERTAAEKVLGLVKASRADQSVDALRAKIRHVYDLCMIVRHDEYRQTLAAKAFPTLLATVVQADRNQFVDAARWLDQPLHEVHLFAQPGLAWKDLRDEFNGPFRDMVYNDDLPDEREVVAMLKLVAAQLARL